MKLIPKKDKGQGLHLYCNKCKREVVTKCGQTGEKPMACKFQKDWKYKMVFHVPVPGGSGRKKTKVCVSNTIEGAMLELHKHKAGVRSQRVIKVNNERTLVEGIDVFLQKKNNKAEFMGQSRILSKDHKDEIIRVLSRFTSSIRNSGRNPDKMMLTDLDDRLLAPFYSYVRTFIKSPAAIDRHTRIMRNFLRFLTDRGMYKGANFFKTVDLNPITTSPISINDEELYAVLLRVTKENGLSRTTKGKNIDYFRPWMKYVFLLGRHTGLRTEEIYELNWENIVSIGEHKLLIVHNLKVERLKNTDNILKVVPITSELEKILSEIKVSDYTGSKIIETGYNSSYFGDLVGRAFTHFYKLTFPMSTPKHFKQLRKKQLSDIYALLGEDAHKLTDHSGNVILEKHYVDKVEAAIKLLELKAK